jgi:Uma2 family endonuclease
MAFSYFARASRRRLEMTTAEYLETPETVLPRELAFGVLRVADAPSVSHQRVVRELTIALHTFVHDRMLGEVLPAPLDVILDVEEGLVVQPDVLFVSNGRDSMVRDRLYGPPDLVIEVLSPHPRIGRLEERVRWFAQYGVRECWLVDIKRREVAVLTFARGVVDERRLVQSDDLIPSRVFPDLVLRPVTVLGF